MMYGTIFQSKKSYVEEFLDEFKRKHKIDTEPALIGSGEYYKVMIDFNGELYRLGALHTTKEAAEKEMTQIMLNSYARKLCELQKQECVKSYQNSTSLYRVSDDILAAKTPDELVS